MVHHMFWVPPQDVGNYCLPYIVLRDGQPHHVLNNHSQCSTSATCLFCIITFFCTVYSNYPSNLLLKIYLFFSKKLQTVLCQVVHCI